MKLTEEMFRRKGWTQDRDKCCAKFEFVGRADTLRLYHIFANYFGTRRRNKWIIHGRSGYDRMEVADTEQLIQVAELMGYEECIINELKQIGL